MRVAARRFSALLCVTLFGVAGTLGIAHANDNDLRGTLTKYSPKIVKDEQTLKNALAKYAHGQPKPLVRALNHEVADLHALRSTLMGESASTARGAKAKALILKGLRLMASAYTTLREDIQAAHGGSLPLTEVKAAVTTRTRGRTKLLAGAKLFTSTAPAAASGPSCRAACAQRLLKAFAGTQSLAGTPPQQITAALT